MFFRFDVNRWILHQLPPVLRRPANYAFLQALLYPLAQLMRSFTTYREAIDGRLSSNAFEIYLERWLNDVLYLDPGTIYITEELLPIATLSKNSEPYPLVYMTYIEEDPQISLDLYSIEPGSLIGRFIVNVPAGLSEGDLALVQDWTNYFKMAGTQYRIEEYD